MKKITITTTYYKCTDEFLNEYVDVLCHNPHLKAAKEKFFNGEEIGFRSDDDQGPTFGITTYKLDDMHEPR